MDVAALDVALDLRFAAVLTHKAVLHGTDSLAPCQLACACSPCELLNQPSGRHVRTSDVWRQDACQLISADAYLDNVHSEACRTLLAALARTAEARVGQLSANAIAGTLWGLTVAQQLPPSLLAKCVACRA